MRAPPLDKLTDLSQSLIDDIINSINNLIYQAISGLETSLIATPPERLGFAHASNGSTIPETDEDGNVLYPEAKLELENGLHQLETLLEANVDKAFDKFEIYVLRNILTVPEDLLSWVRLKHYEVRRCNRATESSVSRIRANIFMA
jgi:kinetochore protein Mis12/MTW1